MLRMMGDSPEAGEQGREHAPMSDRQRARTDGLVEHPRRLSRGQPGLDQVPLGDLVRGQVDCCITAPR